MDIALAVEKILPAAEYRGSVTANTQAAWDAVVWTDTRRSKPTWAELVAAAPDPLEEAQKALQKTFTDAIQAYVDDFARTRGYDDIGSCIGKYSNSHSAKFKAEADYCSWALTETWLVGYAILDAVLAGERPMPTIEEVLAELPALEWPA